VCKKRINPFLKYQFYYAVFDNKMTGFYCRSKVTIFGNNHAKAFKFATFFKFF